MPVTLVLLCEVNPALLALCTAAGLVHEGAAIWDVQLAEHGGREMRPAEQHVHSFLEMLPFMAISALLCLHWEQVADRGGWLAPPRLRRRLPAAYLAAVFGGMAGLIGLPYAEEAWRCARAARRGQAPGSR